MADGFEIGRAFIEVFTEDRTEEGTKSMGKSLLAWAGGIGIGAIVTDQIIGGMDIQAGIDLMQGQLGISADRAGELGKLAGDLYAGNYGESMESVRDTITAVVSTVPGMSEASDEAIQNIAKSAENFKTAFGVPVEESVNSVSLLMTQGLAGSAEEAADLMTAAMQKLPVALRGDFGDVIDEYGQSFALLGFNGSQTMEMLTDAAAQGGIGMDKYGDAIKEFGIRATDMSTTSGAAYAALGLDQKAMSDAILAGGDTAKEATTTIRNALQSMTDPSAQASAALALFGTPLEDLGVGQIPQFLDGLGGLEGGLADVKGAAGELDSTLSGNSKATLETFKRQAMMELSSIINEKVVPAVGWLKDKFVEFKTPITIIAGIITGILIPAFVVAAAQATISAVKQVAAWVMTQAAAVKAAAETVIRVATIVGAWVLMGVQSMLGAAKVAAAWLISMGPIALVIAAVVGLVAIIILNWDTIKNAITTAVQFVLDWLSANWPLILAIITGPIGLIVLAVITYWDEIMGVIGGAVSWIQSAVGSAFNTVSGVVGSVMGAISGAVSTGIGAVKTSFDEVVSFVTGLPERIASAASGMWDGISTAFKSTINKVIGWWNGLSLGFDGFTLHIPMAPDISVPGFSIGTPNIPMLARGAYVKSSFGNPLVAGIGEGRDDEIVSPVPMLEKIVKENSARGGGLTNEDRALLRSIANRPVEVSVDGKTIFRAMQKVEHREAARA